MINEYQEYSKIFNNWEVKRLIGAGSYGKVFELERIEGDVVYKSALKVITIPQNDSEIKSKTIEGESHDSIVNYYRGFTEQLLNENRIMAGLKGNSNIVSYEDHQVVHHEDGIGCDIFIRMELLTSFMDYMASNEIDEDTIVKLGIDLCKALEVCEKKNIIHRDIKPGNIFVSEGGDFKLGDFGIARTIEKTEGGLSKKGTYRYMAPEVYKGEAYGRTVDICSLGLVMYYLANGKRTPFLPDAPAQVTYSDEEESLIKRMRGERIMPPKFASNGLAMIILKACSYDPYERYQSASEMKEALESLRTGTIDFAVQASSDMTVIDAGNDSATNGTNNEQYQLRSDSQDAQYGSNPQHDGRKQYDNRRQNGFRDSNAAANGNSKRTIILVAILIAVAVAAAIAVIVVMNTNGSSVDSGNNKNICAVDPAYVTVLDSDWDWDSSHKNSNGTYTVDGILYVENKSNAAIMEIVFSVKNKHGNTVANAEDGSSEFIAYGYISPGDKGIMVSDVNTASKNVKPDNSTYSITETYSNDALADYVVPSGEITDNYGVSQNNYDISLDNFNDVEVNSNSKIVMVKMDGNDIAEADATGEISGTIPAGETNYIQEKAFFNPNLFKKKNEKTGEYELYKYDVYAIDIDLYKYYDGE